MPLCGDAGGRQIHHMIAVVTGSSGFIGSHLVDALLAKGATVRALVRPASRSASRDSGLDQWEADLLDARAVRESPVWEGATHVFHVAGVTKGRTLSHFRVGNVFPTTNLLAALAERAGARPRVIVVSSQAAAGPAPRCDAPRRESDRPLPVEAYGRSKLQAEQAVRRYRDRLAITVVRPAAVYGPRDRDFLNAFRQATSRVAIHAVPRDHAFSLVHVSDVVSALVLAAERDEAAGRTYFLAGERPVTWRALYALIAESAGTRPLELQLPLPALQIAARAADLVGSLTGRHTLLNRNKAALARPRWWLCDASLVRDELGWTPAVGLQEGVRETYLWYLEAGWLPRPRHWSPAEQEDVMIQVET